MTTRGRLNSMQRTQAIMGSGQTRNDRQVARVIGIFFISASASAILGLLLYGPILTGPDNLTNGAAHPTQVALGALMELILVISAIGTAIGMFPFLRSHGERIALAHLFFRFLEAVVITVGVAAVLSLLTLSQDFTSTAAADAPAYHTASILLLAMKNWTFMMGPLLFLGINTLMYSSLLYKSRLVPRPLAVLGITGAVLVFCSGLLVLFGVVTQLSTVAVVMAFPIAIYEMILAVWLIAKGFNPSAVAATPARTETKELFSAA